MNCANNDGRILQMQPKLIASAHNANCGYPLGKLQAGSSIGSKVGSKVGFKLDQAAEVRRKAD